MKNTIFYSLTFFLLVGCASAPSPQIVYVNKNLKLVNEYIEKYGSEISELSTKIAKKCYLDILNNRNNLNFASIVNLGLQGIVTYELNETGIITSAVYNSKDRYRPHIKERCIKKVAEGYQLPPPGTLKMVYSEFKLTHDG